MFANELPEPHKLVEYEDGSKMAVMFHYAPDEYPLGRLAASLGYDYSIVQMTDNLPHDHPLQIEYENGGADVVDKWLHPPPKPGWSFGGKWDTEDGPVACYLRKKTEPRMTTHSPRDGQ